MTAILAAPRGFCAGVSRAIEAVETALREFGPPVYVRHEIVHNRHVVDRLRAMGAVFVDEVADARPDRPLVFSAHGSPARAHGEARARGVTLIDAACPLVLKVHAQVRRFVREGRHVVVVGHADHVEVDGVVGQAEAHNFTLVETVADAETVALPAGPLAYVTQTTLSVDDAQAVIERLKARRPDILAPRSEDICYATSNRQDAVKAVAARAPTVLVVGSPTSSNSRRLVEVALQSGAREARLVDDPDAFDPDALAGRASVGVTAGASSPEDLVEALLARLAGRFALSVETVETAREDVVFKPPPVRAP
ncbi:MAG: 4-hydroxy-3-methylbut-2-enyl diphosphate reductase [Pseudomonadota bacterium]